MAKSKKKNDNIFQTAIVEKRNVLNEIHKNNMSLQELRFFSIYLSKINARDISTRVVKFSLEDFKRIMDFQSLNLTQLRQSFVRLLQQCVSVPNENGRGFSTFQLFKRCKLLQDEFDEWYVEIDAHDDALPLMFDFKNRYFTYELWNALQLKSPNQIRMYEILKQYETLGKREIAVAELRELLGIAPNEYSRWERFKVRVLDSCQQALAENTDITYTYEKGKSGKGGKWLTIVFHIQKNNKHTDQLSLSEFIEKQPKVQCEQKTEIDYDDVDEPAEKEIDYGGELANLLGNVACDDEFSPEQIRVIQDLVIQAVGCGADHLKYCDYLIHKMHLVNHYNPKTENRFKYLLTMINNDIKDPDSAL
jgi:plasmid replication initiation protein